MLHSEACQSPAERLKRANSLPIYRIAQHRSGPVRLN